jgi:hypothetical protein
MKIINQLLGKTSEAYETLRFQIFFNWCCHYGRTPSRTQSLLANSNVSRWFNTEYHKLELKFLAEVDPCCTIEAIQAHYNEVTSYILHFYPRPEVMTIKKIKFDTQNYN